MSLGLETFTFQELLCLPASAVGLMLWEVVLTRDEVDGLMAGLVASGSGPTGATGLADRLHDNRNTLGRYCLSEL